MSPRSSLVRHHRRRRSAPGREREVVCGALDGEPARSLDVARRVSPLTYVRSGLPPILTIHGDADPTVPYQHAVRLGQELDNVGVANELHTVPGGGQEASIARSRLRFSKPSIVFSPSTG